ncbi:type I-E CRISPR-associated protein Cse1/CasA [Natronoglycomyces albus]|uniref:Type I-E CRISPR-associated protein Cse1/CasA n=1 Tax=Natronoglycomyces albus TaxID=2811108 RepID=A0A895XTB4_9ACTN|nr:type I-E CRISPR-associated protein Cse1/CasA [Natronoglycomyces albus]QSB06525.1 type I-E CRISPR-associated protein Cse1/CasA [Natronoglycomyces albus]
MGSQSFDLRVEPWIDVSWKDPTSKRPPRVGLRDLFAHAGEIAGFEAPFAPAASGFMRILVVLTARMTGLDAISTKAEWQQRRRDLLAAPNRAFDPEAIARVLDDADGFDLFGPRPFLQEPRLALECKSSSGLNKFVWPRASGANQVFLSHDRDADPKPIPAAEAPWHLLTWLYYGPSGRCTARKVGDVDKADTGGGPLRRTLSVHPWGDDLYETLLLNQVYLPSKHGLFDQALWEAGDSDVLEGPPEGSGLAWQLANRFRHAVLLVPDSSGQYVEDAYATWAWRRAHPPADDPYIPFQLNEKTGERYPRYAQADRAIWRDLDSLILHVPAEAPVSHPRVLVDFKGRPAIPDEVMRRLRIRAFGYEQDGQTRDKAFFETTTPPVLSALDDPALEVRIERVHLAATQVGEQLRRTLRAAWVDLAGKPKKEAPWLAPAMAVYWSRAGEQFWRLIGTDEALPALPNAFIRIATAVFEQATGAYGVSPVTISKLETHRSRLFRGWQKETRNDDHRRRTQVEQSRHDGEGPDTGSEDEDW